MRNGSTLRACPSGATFNGDLAERLRRYARSDARRSEGSVASARQELPALLVQELTSIGAQDVRLTAEGAVLATIPATAEGGVPAISFLVPLLGPDDNEGAAITMTLAGYLLDHPDVRHGPIRIGFAPDEEIGRGVHRHLPDELDAAVIYTFKPDDRSGHGPRPGAQRPHLPGVRRWNRIESAARLAEMCVDVVSLGDRSG